MKANVRLVACCVLVLSLTACEGVPDVPDIEEATEELVYGGPDLSILYLQKPAYAYSGVTLPLTLQIRNGGNVAAVSSFVAVKLIPYPGSTVVSEGIAPAQYLIGGSTAYVFASVDIPATVPAGLSKVEVCADALQQMAEVSEINNCRSFYLTVYDPPQ